MSKFRARVSLLLIFVFIIVIIPLFSPRYAQQAWYHDFADQRPFFGIPHMCNVVSNLPFVLVGLFGLYILYHARSGAPDTPFAEPVEKLQYWFFSISVVLTGFGSAYYHLKPGNNTLVWDRLPLALGLMALLSAVIGERIHRRTGTILLVPLLLVGVISVLYWHRTEMLNRGDLRWYLAVQFGTLVLLLLIFLLFSPQYTRSTDLWYALGWYVLAKVLEIVDEQIYSVGSVISGHTLKHLAACTGLYMILHRLTQRRVV